MGAEQLAQEQTRIIDQIRQAVSDVFMGRGQAIDLALICLLSDGHLLIEDVPGSGKTSLSAALARALGLDFNRVQCTNDLLPADITGLSVFDRQSGQFSVKEGPVFTQILLADELNRAPSKTQSALLQAMEEREVSIDTVTKPLPTPFLVIATQNPRENIGTFDLPESQLDRFSLSMAIGRPDTDVQRHILSKAPRRSESVPAIVTSDDVVAMQAKVSAVTAHDDVISYLLRVSDEIEARCHITLSVRYRQQLLSLARAHAYLAGRDYVTPDDVKSLVPHSLFHRLGRGDKAARQDMLASVLAETALP
ncbi:MAG: AAA family ATPase [Candidatus Puniceispirillaceae bacterium]